MNELEQLRRAHFTTETNIKVLGVAMMIAGFVVAILGLSEQADDTVAVVICLALGGALGLGGFWLRRLDVRGRSVYTGAAILGALSLGLVWFREGSIPDGVQDYLVLPLLALGVVVWSGKATTVMSARYRDEVIPATPQVEARVSPKFVFVMFLVLLVVAAAVFAAAIE